MSFSPNLLVFYQRILRLSNGFFSNFLWSPSHDMTMISFELYSTIHFVYEEIMT